MSDGAVRFGGSVGDAADSDIVCNLQTLGVARFPDNRSYFVNIGNLT